MADKSEERLRVGSKVVAAADLRGVPAGTAGRIRMASGLTWERYWVTFDNGVWLGSIDRRKLATPDEWERRDEIAAEEASAQPAQDAAPTGDGDAAEAPASTGGVPAHLLERAKRARERAAAKQAG